MTIASTLTHSYYMVRLDAAYRVGFTATRSIRDADLAVVRARLELLPPTAVWVTGACRGGDAAIARFGMAWGRHVHAVVPANRAQVDPEWRRYCRTFEEMPAHRDPYRARNLRIVRLSHEMVGFAAYPEDHPKSGRGCGTWMTIRLARKAGVPVDVRVLNAG